MEIQFAKQCGSRHDQLDLCKVCGLTKNIDVTLHELTETASLRTVCSPYISHLQCLEWCRKLAGIVGIISGKRYSQVITKSGVYQICLTLCCIKFQFFSTFEDLEDQFLIFPTLFAAEVLDVLHARSLNCCKSEFAVSFTDHVHHIITDLHFLW